MQKELKHWPLLIELLLMEVHYGVGRVVGKRGDHSKKVMESGNKEKRAA